MMLLHEPPPSQADVHFRLFGFPVRIHPFFWVVAVLLGLSPGSGGTTAPEELLVWVGVVFVSILVHECGHAFVQRRFGGRPWIVLHSFGGLAICSDCDRSPRSQILISLAGPAAGFLLALVAIVIFRAAGTMIGVQLGPNFEIERTPLQAAHVLNFGLLSVYWSPARSEFANSVIGSVLAINIVWGLVNLLPIYPLDGGQISREVCTLSNPARGIVLSLQISMVCAGAMAVFGALVWRSLFVAVMFGILAYSNYRTFDAYRASRW